MLKEVINKNITHTHTHTCVCRVIGKEERGRRVLINLFQIEAKFVVET